MSGASQPLVLRLAGEQALAKGHFLLDHAALERACRAEGLDHGEFFRELRALAHDRLVDMHFVEPSLVTLLRLTDAGLRAHLAAAGPELADVRSRVLAALHEDAVDWRGGEAVDLAAAIGAPSLVVELTLEDLRRERLVVFSVAPGRRVRVHRLSPPRAGA